MTDKEIETRVLDGLVKAGFEIDRAMFGTHATTAGIAGHVSIAVNRRGKYDHGGKLFNVSLRPSNYHVRAQTFGSDSGEFNIDSIVKAVRRMFEQLAAVEAEEKRTIAARHADAVIEKRLRGLCPDVRIDCDDGKVIVSFEVDEAGAEKLLKHIAKLP